MNSGGDRTQRIEVQGRAPGASSFTTLVPAADYRFSPAQSNAVGIPVDGRAADLRLVFTANSGAPAGQVGELQVMGEPAPNPDLEVTAITAEPAVPLESDPVELTATVRNGGPVASAATTATPRCEVVGVGVHTDEPVRPGCGQRPFREIHAPTTTLTHPTLKTSS